MRVTSDGSFTETSPRWTAAGSGSPWQG